jgi:uncharacterized protein
MTLGEMGGHSAPDLLAKFSQLDAIREGTVAVTMDPLPLLARGFMPPLLTLSGQEAATRWWEGYIATYLERDLRQISQIESLPDFDRLMRALAFETVKC